MHIHRTIAAAAAIAVAMPLTATFTPPVAATDQPVDEAMQAAKVKNCKGRQLRIRFGRSGAAAGTLYRTIRFRNTGKRCAVRTWPEVGYARKRGRPVGFLATHPRQLRRPVVLRHGEVGRVALGTPDWRNFPRRACGARRATKLAVYIPGRIRPRARHLRKLPHGAMRVCTSRQGRPSLSRLR